MEVAPVVRGTIRSIVTADAVLYPRDQANINPKISAPVRKFLVNRGDHVKQGQLLAELENLDLVGAATESRGLLAQAESTARVSNASVPEQMTKAQTDVDAARAATDAAQKLVDSRQQLFTEGAIARKLVDEAQVALAQARAQLDTAQQHLTALQAVGRQEVVKNAAAQVEAARGHNQTVEAQVGYSEIRSPINGVVTDRPLYAGEMANAGMPLLTVMDVSSIVARVNLSQSQAKDVKVGNEATLDARRWQRGGDRQGHDCQPGGRRQQHHGASVGAGRQSGRAAARRRVRPRDDHRRDDRRRDPRPGSGHPPQR